MQGMVGLSDAGMAALGELAALRELDVQFCWQFTDEGGCGGGASQQGGGTSGSTARDCVQGLFGSKAPALLLHVPSSP